MNVGLITALLQRWHQEIHIFHLLFGKTTITLQNVSVLIGLPVDGEAVIGADLTLGIQEWQTMYY